MRINENSACLNKFVEFALAAVLSGKENAVAVADGTGDRLAVRELDARNKGRSYAPGHAPNPSQLNVDTRNAFFQLVARLFPAGVVPESVERLMSDEGRGHATPLEARHIIAVMNEIQIMRSWNEAPILKSGEINHAKFIQPEDARLTGEPLKERVQTLAKQMNAAMPADRRRAEERNSLASSSAIYYDENSDCNYSFKRFHQNGGGGNHCFFLSALHHLGMKDSNANACALREIFRATLQEVEQRIDAGDSPVEKTVDNGKTHYVLHGKDGSQTTLTELFKDEPDRTLSFDLNTRADMSASALLAHHLQRPVVVFTTDNEGWNYSASTFGTDILTGDRLDGDPVYIWYEKGSHFEAMEPEGENFKRPLATVELHKPFSEQLPEGVDRETDEMTFRFFNQVADSILVGNPRQRKASSFKVLMWQALKLELIGQKSDKQLEAQFEAYRNHVELANSMEDEADRQDNLRAAKDNLKAWLERYFKDMFRDAFRDEAIELEAFTANMQKKLTEN